MANDKFRQNIDSTGWVNARGGLLSRGLPVLGTPGFLAKGNVIHVDSGHSAASDTNSGKSPDFPKATIDSAVGECTASNGDIIVVSEGHAETLTGAAGIALDVAGVTILGLGNGELRPTITFGTAVAASVDVSAANCRISNILFKNNIDSQTAMINVTADDVMIDNCEFREGSAKQALIAINVGAANNDADRFKAYFNRFYEGAAAGAASAIKLTKAQDGVELVGNYIWGDFSDAGIHNPTSAICTNLLIANNVVSNLNAGNHAIELVSACTGHLVGNRLYSDAAATILDPGSLKCLDNLGAKAIDEASFPVPLATPDTTDNYIGADNANNAAATTNVAANEDGSVLERLEQIQEAVNKGTGTALAANESLVDILYAANGIGTFPAAAAPANGISIAEVLRSVYDRQLGDGTNAATNGVLGKRVDRATADTITGAAVPIFTVATGRVLLLALTGKVTTIIGAGVTNAKFQFNPTTGTTNDMCANLDIDSDEAGALYSLTGTPTDAMLRSESGAVRNMTARGIILDVGDIEFITSADRTGSISFQAWYIPLDNGATLAAA